MNDDVQEWQPLEFPVPVVRGGRATTYEEQLAYFERHPDFESEFKERLNALWEQYAGKDASELEADQQTLREHVRRLEAVTETADTLRPDRSDPDTLPDGIGMARWKSFTREERIRLYEKCQRELKAVRFHLSVVRNVLWRESMHGDREAWGGFGATEADEPATGPGRPSTAEADPEQIRDVLAVVLAFADDYDPEGGHVPFERVREAVRDGVASLGSTSGAGKAVLNAVEHLRSEYGADVPKPSSTVAYYAEHRAALHEALDAFERKRLSQ